MIATQAAAPPLVTETVVREFVADCIRREKKTSHPRAERMLLLHGRYAGSRSEFTVDRVQVTVRDAPSILGVLEACLEHEARRKGDDAEHWLVVLTPRESDEFGNDLLARAHGRRRRSVSLWQVVAQRFGVTRVDPALRRKENDWLADALLQANGGLDRPLAASELTKEAVLRRLVAARLGLGDGETRTDPAELLERSWDSAFVKAFVTLTEAERMGIGAWLTMSAGASAEVFQRVAERGRGEDTLPFGLVADLLWRTVQTAGTEDGGYARGSAESAILGGRFVAARDASYTEAAHGVVTRWIQESAGSHPRAVKLRRSLEDVLERADAIAAECGATAIAAGSSVLECGLDMRLAALGTAVREAVRKPSTASLTAAEEALKEVTGHELAQLRRDRVEPAEMAVRLLRWLAHQEACTVPGTVAAGVTAHIGSLAWVDRALEVLWAGAPVRDHDRMAPAYQAVYAMAREVRDRIDVAFAGKLAAWSAAAVPADARDTADTGALLPIEDVLQRAAVPLAKRSPDSPPLILVLDGMSGSVAVQLAEAIRDAGWIELSLDPDRNGRLAALAMTPSITKISRASLLTGVKNNGGQSAEERGFVDFWKRSGKKAELFHSNDLRGTAGRQLAPGVARALAVADPDAPIVGIVLNTIDDALDNGRQTDRPGWRLDQVSHLTELLNEARRQGRPILLTSDHGHVLEREEGEISGDDAASARWRAPQGAAGAVQEGEVAISGPRVLIDGGSIIAAVREDLRYTRRKAGYHGGASLAEMTVPVLVFASKGSKAAEDLPKIAAEHATPGWWRQGTEIQDAVATQMSKSLTRKTAKPAEALFDVEGPAAPAAPTGSGLGARLVASDLYGEQRRIVGRKVGDEDVKALIDALVDAGLVLSLPRLGEVVSAQARRNLVGWLVFVRTILNVDSYPVLTQPDRQDMIRLDVHLLRRQFGLGDV